MVITTQMSLAKPCTPFRQRSVAVTTNRMPSTFIGSKLHSSPSLTLSTRSSSPMAHGLTLLTNKTRSRQSVSVHAFRNSGRPDIPDRVIGALPYLLPLFDGLRYGKFLFIQFPVLANILLPFDPLIRLYFSVPFAGIVAFFAVYLGIINNQSLSRYVRFNAMQAVLLDIILILPGLIESVLRVRPSGGFGLQLYITSYNTVFFFLFICVALGIGSCMSGVTARLPYIADAADAQVR